MNHKPAHKDTDTPPGQVVNPIERSKTIGGIIDRVLREEAKPIKQKLTFDEWLKVYESRDFRWFKLEDMMACWKAAQENA